MVNQLDERGDPASKTHDPIRKEYSATEARQGFLGAPVVKVLGVSLLLALAAWGAVEFWGRSNAPAADPATQTTTSPASDTAAPSGQDTIDTSPPEGTTGQTVPTDQDPTPQSGTGGESQQTTPDGTPN